MIYATTVAVIQGELHGMVADEGVAILVVRNPRPGQVENLRQFARTFPEGDANLWSSVAIKPEIVRGPVEDLELVFTIDTATGETKSP